MPDPITAMQVARAFDVPPWLIGTGVKRPRLARARWALRRFIPSLIWSTDA